MPRVLAVLFVAAGIALFIALAAACWPFTPDDSFITLRYARNLAAGAGLTFNPGEMPRAEGYTSFTWAVLLAVPHALGWDALWFAKLVGVLAMLVGLGLSAQIARQLAGAADARLAAAFSVLLLGSLPATAVHAVSGMETALFTALLTAYWLALMRFCRHATAAHAAALGLAGLLTALTRPEGNLAVVVGAVMALPLLEAVGRRRLIASMTLLYGGGAAAYFLWRVSYYGQWFPLPFYVKVATAPGLAGAVATWEFCKYFGAHLGVFLLAAMVRLPRTAVPALLAAFCLGLFFIVPAPMMNYDWRFVFPLLPFLCGWAAAGAAQLCAWVAGTSAQRLRQAGSCVVAFLPVVVAAAWMREAPDVIGECAAYARGLQRAHHALGQQLRPLRRSDSQPLLAIGDSGAVPYDSGWRTLDTFGLNDAHIARSGAHDADYVLAQRPDLLVLISSRADQYIPTLPWEERLYRAAVGSGLSRLRLFTFEDDQYYLWVMGHPGSDIAAALAPPSR